MSTVVCSNRIISTNNGGKKNPKRVIGPSKIPSKPLEKLETLGGRLAMQGVLWGSVNYMMFNEGLSEQLTDPKTMLLASAVTGLVAAGSAFTLDNMGEEEYLYWKPEVETLNGRLAMVAVTTGLLLT